IVGTHFWNPAFLIPLVGIIRTEDTSDEVVESVYEFLKWAGKRPVRVNKDVPGFIGNRLQHALLREALYIVENGIADPATVDEAVKYGFGMRTPVLGPMEHADMVGTDLSLAIQEYLLKHLASSTEPSHILKDAVEKGDLGFKSGKGIQEWSPEEVAASKRRLNDHLLKSLKDRG
ncbi:MAG: 3-hydroxyacyl-CoA dehydrogenase family protein, partial [Firmicutes bacterium]|nr:3-hydroxyacyl-CoA dehydrogenase family protein [Bacillota bacterium]